MPGFTGPRGVNMSHRIGFDPSVAESRCLGYMFSRNYVAIRWVKHPLSPFDTILFTKNHMPHPFSLADMHGGTTTIASRTMVTRQEGTDRRLLS